MSVLIRQGKVLTSTGLVLADVLVRDAEIVEIAQHIAAETDHTIDAHGCLVGPGFVDIHTHLREPGETWKEDIRTGSEAAAAGGFTAVVAMPNTEPPIDRPGLARQVISRGEEVGLVEVAAGGAVTVGRSGTEITDLEAMYEVGVRIFTDDGDCVEDEGVLREAMLRLAALPGAVMAQHAEDSTKTIDGHMHEGRISARHEVAGLPAAAEEEIVRRDLEVVATTGAGYHCQHVSSAGTVELIRRARQSGLRVTAEVTPHHLSFSEDDAIADGGKLNANFKMYPPLRTIADRRSLRSALVDRTIDAVATDHAPHSSEEKAQSFDRAPRGVIGLETAASVVWAILGDPLRLFECLSMTPARIAGLDRQGHRLAIGGTANIVVFDPVRRWTAGRFMSKAENSPYEGREMEGRTIATLYQGSVVHELERDPV